MNLSKSVPDKSLYTFSLTLIILCTNWNLKTSVLFWDWGKWNPNDQIEQSGSTFKLSFKQLLCLSYFFQTYSLVCKLNLILSSAEFVNKLKIHTRKINVSVKCLHGHLKLNILKHFKKTTLDLMQFLPEGQIISVFDNEMDKYDQLACIRYKNQNVLS